MSDQAEAFLEVAIEKLILAINHLTEELERYNDAKEDDMDY